MTTGRCAACFRGGGANHGPEARGLRRDHISSDREGDDHFHTRDAHDGHRQRPIAQARPPPPRSAGLRHDWLETRRIAFTSHDRSTDSGLRTLRYDCSGRTGASRKPVASPSARPAADLRLRHLVRDIRQSQNAAASSAATSARFQSAARTVVPQAGSWTSEPPFRTAALAP